MKKANVSYEEVVAYCDRQAAKGVDPDRITCREVITELGCNSSTSTISDYLKRWRDDHAHAVLSGVVLTEADIASVFMAIKQVVAAKCAERERELIGHVDDLKRRLENTTEELEALLEENRLLCRRVESLEGQLTDAKGTSAILQATLATIVGVGPEPAGSLSSNEDERSRASIDQDDGTAFRDEQALPCSPLPPEAFGDSHQEPALAPATGQAGLPFSAAAGNGNKGHEEKPNA